MAQKKISEQFLNAFSYFSGANSIYDIALSPNYYGQSPASINSYRIPLGKGKERSIVAAIYERIARDVAAIEFKHVELDQNGRYVKEINSGLNRCLTLEANSDQTSRAFIMNVILSLFDEGYIAIFPENFDSKLYDPTEIVSIGSLRVAKITEWFTDSVVMEGYNKSTGLKQILRMPKKMVAIIENPFYSVMNERNSILQRLIRKLNLLDVVDEQSSSGKLDLIVQLPYPLKSESQKEQAKYRRNEIERQLKNSKFGIAYTDATEKIVQLNRPIENTLMEQVKFLTSMAYAQFGVTEDLLNGKAKEEENLNYLSNIVEPLASAISDEMKRKFINSEQRENEHQSIMFFKNTFKLIPTSKIADIADKFTRNEIMSSNEVRQIVGLKPVDDPRADELKNKNINSADGQEFASTKKSAGDKNSNIGRRIQNGEEK